MSWYKRAVRSVGKTLKKAVSYDPMIGSFFQGSGSDARGEAAGKLVKKDAQKQGGSGQVKFKTEVYE